MDNLHANYSPKTTMKFLPNHIATLAITLWVGGLWAIGYLAVPTLFYTQTDRQLAGILAGSMFETLGYVGIVCGLYLVLHRWFTVATQIWRDFQSIVVLAMLTITLVMQFYIQPLMGELKLQVLPLEIMHSALATQFKMWHGISSILYLIESLLGAWLVILKQLDSRGARG
jgi:hypothetical protein